MSKFVDNKNNTMIQTGAHFISESLKHFFGAEYPNQIMNSTLNLLIGLEIFIKEELHEITPGLISRKLVYKENENFKNDELLMIKKAHKLELQEDFLKKTISFEHAIDIFKTFKKIDNDIYDMLIELKEYRNNIFHWNEEKVNIFQHMCNVYKVYLWLFEYHEIKYNHYLGGRLNIIDPMNSQRVKLKKLDLFVNDGNELGFFITSRYLAERKKRDNYALIPGAIMLKHSCSCGGAYVAYTCQVGLVIRCIDCDFYATKDELNAINQGHIIENIIVENDVISWKK